LMKSIASLFDDANIELDERSLTVYADENQLQQVLVNLIRNAQQAMLNNLGGKIILSWQQLESRIEIQVVDQGMGINNPDNLFVPFYTTKENGSGIGLVLSRQIINNHGGDLTISNRLDDIGAKATVYLPAASRNN
jgi:two-component system nitrogen regulation sensor histidine kinase NtrY